MNLSGLQNPSAQDLYEIESEGLSAEVPRWSLDNYVQELKSPQSRLYWSAELEAFVLYREIVSGEYEIMNLSIRHKGQGKAKFLLRAFFEDLKKTTHTQEKEITLHLEVRASNRAAYKLYLSQGFEIVGQRKRYYTNGEDAVLMKKTILTSGCS